jgi:hypothetical protein
MLKKIQEVKTTKITGIESNKKSVHTVELNISDSNLSTGVRGREQLCKNSDEFISRYL